MSVSLVDPLAWLMTDRLKTLNQLKLSKLAAGEDCFSDYSITIALSSLDNPIPYMTINFMVEGFWDKDYSKIHNWTPAYNMTWNGEYTISTWQKHEKECD